VSGDPVVFLGPLVLDGVSAEGRVRTDESESTQTFPTHRIICAAAEAVVSKWPRQPP